MNYEPDKNNLQIKTVLAVTLTLRWASMQIIKIIILANMSRFPTIIEKYKIKN